MKVVLAILVALFLSPSVVSAQEPDNPKALSEQFLNLLHDVGVDPAIRFLGDHFGGAPENVKTLGRIKEVLDKVSEASGPPREFELVREDKLGQSLEALTYVLKYEKFFIVAYLYFYKYSSQWAVVNFSISDNPHYAFQRPPFPEK